MKNLIAITLLISILISCKKNDSITSTPVPPATVVKHTPNVLTEYQVNKNGATINGKFIFYNLNHTNNADKQFFIVNLIKNGNDFLDSCEVVQQPKTIDSLALGGWPSNIQSAAFGVSYRIIVDAKTEITGSQTELWELKNLTQANMFSQFNDPVKAGIMAGKKPLAFNTVIEDYKVLPVFPGYRQYYRPIAYYFKEGKYTDNANGVCNLDTLYEGASNINWINIDAMAQVEIDATYFLKKHIYFDFTNWEFYVVNETRNKYPGTNNNQVKFNFKGKYSLNKFCKWPTNWGKK